MESNKEDSPHNADHVVDSSDTNVIKKHPIWGYETLDDLRRAIRQNPKYRKYTDEEIDQMSAPWFIRDKYFRISQVKHNVDITGETLPYDYFRISRDDIDNIRDGLEVIRVMSIDRQHQIDTGQEPIEGYDEDLAIQRKVLILSNGLPRTPIEKFVFGWKKFWTDNGEFEDPRTGVQYDKRGCMIPGSEHRFMERVKSYEREIQLLKELPPSSIPTFIKSLSGIVGTQ